MQRQKNCVSVETVHTHTISLDKNIKVNKNTIKYIKDKGK